MQKMDKCDHGFRFLWYIKTELLTMTKKLLSPSEIIAGTKMQPCTGVTNVANKILKNIPRHNSMDRW